jgi:hypothetical protein
MLIITKANVKTPLSNYGLIKDATNIKKTKNIIRFKNNLSTDNLNIIKYGDGFGIVLRPKSIVYNLSNYKPTKNISGFEGFFDSIGDFFGNIGSGIGNVFSSIGKGIGGNILGAGLSAITGLVGGGGITTGPMEVGGEAVSSGAGFNPLESLGPLTLPIDALPISEALPSIVNETGNTILNTGMNISNSAINSTELTAPISGLNPFNVAPNPLAINLPGTTDLLNQLNPNINMNPITVNPVFTQPTSNLVETLGQQNMNAATNLTNILNEESLFNQSNFPSSTDILKENMPLPVESEYPGIFEQSSYPSPSDVLKENMPMPNKGIVDTVKDITSSKYAQDILKYGSQIVGKFFGSGQQAASQQSTQSASPNTMVYVIGNSSNQAPNTSPDMYNNQGAYLPGSQSVGDSGSTPNPSIPTTDGTASQITQAIQKYMTPTNVKYGLIGMGLLILISTLKSSGSKGEEFKLVRIK